MLTKGNIQKYLSELNGLLKDEGVKGEICLYGGAVMRLTVKCGKIP